SRLPSGTCWGKGPARQAGPTSISVLLSAAFHHRDLIAAFGVFDAIHEGLDKQQTTAAGVAEIGGVGRIGQERGVKPLALIADDEDGFSRRQGDADKDTAIAPRRLRPPLRRQAMILLL